MAHHATTTTRTTRNGGLMHRLTHRRRSPRNHHNTYATTTTTRRREPVHHHKRHATLGDKVSGALLKLKGSLTRRPGQKAAGTRRMHGTDGRGSHQSHRVRRY